MTRPQTRRSHAKPATLGETLRGLLALTALLGMVGGVPAALLFLGSRLPLDPSVLTPDALLRPDDGRLLLLAVFAVAWAAWAAFAGSVTLEVWAVLRHAPTPRLPGLQLPQHAAAALVAAAAVLITPNVPAAHATPVQPARVTAAAVEDYPRALTAPASEPARVLSEQTTDPDVGASRVDDPAPTVVVQRHDTLWSLAEKHLGTGERFTEILDLNKGVIQPDGRQLDNAGWLYPGWVLRLPPDATTTAPRPSEAGEAETHPPETHTVQPGDTLWEIAEDDLGDPARHPEIFQLNHGDPQHDGRRLTDPDLILPGWTLELPQPPGDAPGPPPDNPAAVDGAGQPPEQPSPARPPLEQPPSPSGVPEHTGPQRPTTPTRPGQSHDSVGAEHSTSHDSGLVATLALGVGGIALAGLVAELTRRRRHQQRVRRPGQRIPMPAPDTARVEAAARTAATPNPADQLRTTLRQLAASCATTGRLLPDLLLVRISEDTIQLILNGPDHDAVAPFAATGPATWTLDAGQLAGADNGLAAEDNLAADPYPALLTLGADGEELLLLNLESVGTLQVAGEPSRVADVLRAMAVDLTLGPTAGRAPVTLAAGHTDLAAVQDPGQVRAVPTTAQAEREITAQLTSTAEHLRSAAASNLRGLRSRTADEASGTSVFVSSEQIDRLPGPYSGVAVVTPGLHPAANVWRLEVTSDHQGTLQPLGFTLRPAEMDPATYAHVVDALRVADQQPQQITATADARPSATLPGSPETPDTPAGPELTPDSASAPRVLLLGSVEIQGVEGGAVRYRQARATELIAYLALHPAATGYEIEEALWPGQRVEPATRRQLISRTRTWLGTHPDGDPYLPTTPGTSSDRLRLRPEVSCDWHEFLRLARTGLDHGQEGIPDLEAALTLVRGRPFLGIDPRRYTWAEPDIQEMISSIVDVAHALSTAYAQHGDHPAALRAAIRGLAAEPCSEQLFRDAITAAEAAGNIQEARRLADRLETLTEQNDPDDTLEDETLQLVNRIRQPRLRPRLLTHQA